MKTSDEAQFFIRIFGANSDVNYRSVDNVCAVILDAELASLQALALDGLPFNSVGCLVGGRMNTRYRKIPIPRRQEGQRLIFKANDFTRLLSRA